MLAWEPVARHDRRALAPLARVRRAVRGYETGRTDRVAFADAIIARVRRCRSARDAFLEEFAWWPKTLPPAARRISSASLRAALHARGRCRTPTSCTGSASSGQSALAVDVPPQLPELARSASSSPTPSISSTCSTRSTCAPSTRAVRRRQRMNVEAARAVGLHARARGRLRRASRRRSAGSGSSRNRTPVPWTCAACSKPAPPSASRCASR